MVKLRKILSFYCPMFQITHPLSVNVSQKSQLWHLCEKFSESSTKFLDSYCQNREITRLRLSFLVFCLETPQNALGKVFSRKSHVLYFNLQAILYSRDLHFLWFPSNLFDFVVENLVNKFLCRCFWRQNWQGCKGRLGSSGNLGSKVTK